MNIKLIERRKNTAKRLADKPARDRFVESHIRNGIANQIFAMRTDRGWTQKELAGKAGFKQESVSRLENPDYGSYTLRTLRSLASAFDVALLVRFVPFSELLDKVTFMKPEDLEVPEFAKDKGMNGYEDSATNVIKYVRFRQVNAVSDGNTRVDSSARDTSDTTTASR